MADGLTPREMEILRLVEAGHNSSHIAALLARSRHTVRTHLRNIRRKLETHGRRETLARARERGLLA